ncbi:hypothetical protein C8R46DRAFT_1229447 [Mycena filopes]|nr:hypothetical protein C8R46DRAFT_1229447 [Mycena filopes]
MRRLSFRLPSQYRPLLLPISWKFLDPGRIPTSTQLDSPNRFPFPPATLHALGTLAHLNIGEIPEAAHIQLWPRVWAWVSFVQTYRAILVDCPTQLELASIVFGSMPHTPASLVNPLLQFRSFAIQAWVAFIAHGDLELPGYWELMLFLCGETDYWPIEYMEEFVEGASCVMDLAGIICEHLRLATPERSVRHLFAGMNFIASFNGQLRVDLDAALRLQGLLPLLAQMLQELTPESPPPDTLTMALASLQRHLSRPADLRRWLPQLLHSGLLRGLFCLGNLRVDASVTDAVASLLTRVEHSTVSSGILDRLARYIPETEAWARTQKYTHAPLNWAQLSGQMHLRMRVKHMLHAPNFVRKHGCDNIQVTNVSVFLNLTEVRAQCNQLLPKEQLKTCSGCRSVRYCDRRCQSADWRAHRHHCAALWDSRLRDPVPRRDKALMHALVKESYESAQAKLLYQQFVMSDSPLNPVAFEWNYATSSGVPEVELFRVKTGCASGAIAHLETRLHDGRRQLHLATFPGYPCQLVLLQSETDVHSYLADVGELVQKNDIDFEDALKWLPPIIFH